jgi:hypothetical protein
VPHVRLSVRGPKKTGDPDFLHEAPNRFACAAFSKESRMKFATANKLDRKSGGSPTIALKLFKSMRRRVSLRMKIR